MTTSQNPGNAREFALRHALARVPVADAGVREKIGHGLFTASLGCVHASQSCTNEPRPGFIVTIESGSGDERSPMRSVLVLTVVLMPGATVTQNAPQTPAACEKLA